LPPLHWATAPFRACTAAQWLGPDRKSFFPCHIPCWQGIPRPDQRQQGRFGLSPRKVEAEGQTMTSRKKARGSYAVGYGKLPVAAG
jgi:hypothetical protein